MEQNNIEENYISDEEKNLEALKRELDIKKLNDILQEYFVAEWRKYVPDVDSIIPMTTFCVGIYYNNLQVFSEEFNCRILMPEADEIVSFHARPKQNDNMYEFAVENIKIELMEKIKDVQTRESAYCEFYASPKKFPDRSDGLSGMVLDNPYIVVWGIYEKSGVGSVINEVLKKVMLDYICELVGTWDEIKKIIEVGTGEIKRLVELRKIDFMTDFRINLFTVLRLPEEKLVRSISFMPYERRVNLGKAVFIQTSEFDNLEGTIGLASEDRVEFSDIWMVRKLLEACQDKYYLVIGEDGKENWKILGYVATDNYQCDSRARVSFEGEGKYRIFVGQRELLRFERAEYHIYKTREEREIRELSEKMEEVHKQIIREWAEGITHGGLFIFIKEGINTEVDRLCDKCRRGFRINNISVSNFKQFVAGMAAVDGAILVDYEGVCHAYGVILDGVAKVKGYPQRGARFNSAINYVFGEERTAVIISEDMETPIITVNGKELERNPELLKELLNN